MLNGNFVKTAQQLQHTDQKDVVKVANLVRKLQNLWKSISDPEYRAAVEQLEADSAKTLHVAKKLSDGLEDLNEAIRSGDVAEYSAALNVVKQEIESLNQEVEEVRQKTNVTFNYTAKQLPEGYGLDTETEYDVSLKDLDWFKDRLPDLYFGEKPTEFLVNKTVYALRKELKDEEIRSYFQGDDLNAFLQNFIGAVFNGTLNGKVKPSSAGRILEVKTAPFEVPGLGATVQADVMLLDNTKGPLTGRPSLRGTRRVQAVSSPAQEREPGRVTEKYLLEDMPAPETQPFPPPPTDIGAEASRLDSLRKIAQGNRVPYKVTNLSKTEFAQVLREGYKRVFGKDPTAETLSGAWSQATLESGVPIKLPNNNIGNIKATGGWINSGQPYFIKSTGEYTPDGKYYKEEGTKWRAYPTPVDGAAGYWNLLKSRYGQALDWMAAGDPESAAVVMGLKGYYTASPQKYAKSVKHINNHFQEKIAPQLEGLASQPTDAPGPKPPLKEWANQYTKEEKQAILNPVKEKLEPVKLPTSSPANELDALYERLVAGRPLTNLVKMSIKRQLPRSQALVFIKSSASEVDKIHFAHVVASSLRHHLRIDAEVCVGDSEVEINCSGVGSVEKLSGAIQELSDLTAQAMYQKVGTFVSPTVVSGYQSKHAALSLDQILSNKRKYNLKRFANG